MPHTPSIIAKDADRGTLLRVKNSSFFKTYAEAFTAVTGLKLTLEIQLYGNEHAFPVLVGKRHLGFLVAHAVKGTSDVSHLEMLHAFTLQLGEELNRIILDEAYDSSAYIQDALKFLRAHAHSKVSLREVAEEISICPFKLSRIFKDKTGVTVMEYLARLRVEMARRRLSDPLKSVEIIAQEVGFGSISQFNRTFLKYSGESPSEFREAFSTLEYCNLACA